jgi:transposase
MKTLASWAPAPKLNVGVVERTELGWVVAVDNRDRAACPDCDTSSRSRHSSYHRTLRDLPAQGTPVIVKARVTRWRCLNDRCDRRVFAERDPRLAVPFARRTTRLTGIVMLFGHGVGGRPSERLMARLGMPVSDTAILRSVKELASVQSNRAAVRVVGIDEWAWRKGMNYGTVIVDLERRPVVDLLTDRSAAKTADWFKCHPEIEVISRDRAGLYADAARRGAPKARQIADRFHLAKNLRETIERQLGRFEAPVRESVSELQDDQDAPAHPLLEGSDRRSEAAAHERQVRCGRDTGRQALFDEIRSLYEAGSNVREIARKLGLGRRRVERWVRRIDLPELNVMAPKPCPLAYFGAFLARSWAEGTTKVRHLFSDIRRRDYTGSYSHLASFLAPWRGDATRDENGNQSASDQEAFTAPSVRIFDPMTGRRISPLTAAALCVKPRGLMSAQQIADIDALKAASAEFIAMRRLALRFRGLLRGGMVNKLDVWLDDARKSGTYGMRKVRSTS